MLNFSKLFERLPDAEYLLSRSAEELAGQLLVALEGSEQIIPENAILYDNMKRDIDSFSRKNPNLNYLDGCHDEILLALMEAWQCLVCKRISQRSGSIALRFQ